MDVINGTRKQHFYVNSFLCNNKWQINVLLAINIECSQHKHGEMYEYALLKTWKECNSFRVYILASTFILITDSADKGKSYLCLWSCQCRKWHKDIKLSGKPDTIIALQSTVLFESVCLVLSFYSKLSPVFEWRMFQFQSFYFIINEGSTWNEM